MFEWPIIWFLGIFQPEDYKRRTPLNVYRFIELVESIDGEVVMLYVIGLSWLRMMTNTRGFRVSDSSLLRTWCHRSWCRLIKWIESQEGREREREPLLLLHHDESCCCAPSSFLHSRIKGMTGKWKKNMSDVPLYGLPFSLHDSIHAVDNIQ